MRLVPDLLGIGRHYGDAVISGAEQIAGALVVGHGIGAAAQLFERGLPGHLAGVDLLLQSGGQIEAHFDDRPGLVEARVEHLALHQVTRKGAGGAKAKQGHTQQNTQLGSDLQVCQLHGRSPEMVAPYALGGLIRPTIS
jgi:hypothetical protein